MRYISNEELKYLSWDVTLYRLKHITRYYYRYTTALSELACNQTPWQDSAVISQIINRCNRLYFDIFNVGEISMRWKSLVFVFFYLLRDLGSLLNSKLKTSLQLNYNLEYQQWELNRLFAIPNSNYKSSKEKIPLNLFNIFLLNLCLLSGHNSWLIINCILYVVYICIYIVFYSAFFFFIFNIY